MNTTQRKSLPPIEQIAYVRLLRVADDLSWNLIELLKPVDLTPAQYNVLRILRGAEPDGLACRDIGDRLINRDPDVTRLLDRLEKRSLVQRSREKKDRRVITVRITEQGHKLLKDLDKPIEALHKQQFDQLSQRQVETFISLLEKVKPCKQQTA